LARLVSEDVLHGSSWDWQAYAVKPVAAVDRPARRRSKLLSGALDENTPGGDPQPIGCHRYTARTWRRLFGDIWKLSAVMEEKPVVGDGTPVVGAEEAAGRKWQITWGKAIFHPLPATGGALEFFGDFPEPAEPPVKGRRGHKHQPLDESNGPNGA
jgi:hypothetical protein